MNVLVTYDIATDSAAGRKRLRKIAQACLNYGQRVQFSVFECRVEPEQLELMQEAIRKIVKPSEDSVRMYKLGDGDNRVLWNLGKERYNNYDTSLIV